MVLIVGVLTIVYGFLLFSPLPPIQPFLPRPPQASLAQPPVTQRRSVPVTSGNPQLQTSAQKQQTTLQTRLQTTEKELNLLYTKVAARSLGEGSFALAEIACTIKNRLYLSHLSLVNVLGAYHAGDIPPKPADVEIVRQVFEGELPCPSTWWYALSLQDTYTWRPHQRPPVKTIKQNERKQILIFDR